MTVEEVKKIIDEVNCPLCQGRDRFKFCVNAKN